MLNRTNFSFFEVSSVINDLEKLYPTGNIIIGGDFVTPDEALDRHPPKSNISQPNPLITSFCNNLKLIDIWRHLNPDIKQFSWFRPNASSKSRIDFWLTSDNIVQFVKDCSISPAPLTDHCAISLAVSPNCKRSRNKGYWKFNSELLNNEDFCGKVKDLIKNIADSNDFSSHRARWEFLKFKICKLSINYSKILAKVRKQHEHNIIYKINQLCKKSTLKDDEKNDMSLLQLQLDDLYMKKARAAYIRSKAKWIEVKKALLIFVD